MEQSWYTRLFPHFVRQIRGAFDQQRSEECIRYLDNKLRTLLRGNVFLLIGCLIVFFVVWLSGSRRLLILLPAYLPMMAMAASYALNFKELLLITGSDHPILADVRKSFVRILSVIFSIPVVTLFLCLFLLESSRFSGSDKEMQAYDIEYSELGIRINIPDGWNEPQWEYKSEDSATRPNYRFHTSDSDHTMWFYVAGHSVRPSYDIMDFTFGWQGYIPEYLDKEIIDSVRIVEIDGMKVLRAIGRRTGYPDFTYVCYKALHCSSLIDYTYCFRNTLPYKEEVATSAKIFKMIDFTDVEVPLYNREGTRLADWSFDDGCLDIASAGVKFMLPVGEEVQWEENSRSKYVFTISLGEYDLHFDLTVTYTSETAGLMEFYEDFESVMNSRMKAGFRVRPCVRQLKDIRAMHAAGVSPDNPQFVEVGYEMIYKGARLCVEAHVPCSMKLDKEIVKIEKVLNSIEYY